MRRLRPSARQTSSIALALPGQAHISAATRQFLRYLDRRGAVQTLAEACDLTTDAYLCIITTKSQIFCEFCPPPFGDREESNVTYTVDDKMKTLLAAPEAVAVLERFFPKILKNPVLQMTAAMTLRQVAGFAQSGLTAESLAEIDAQLRALPSSEG